MKKTFNIDLLWERIYHYVDYSNLTKERKKVLDKIYHNLYDSLKHTQESNKYRNENRLLDVFDYTTTETKEFRFNLGNWLIDNRLNLVFSNIFGHHEGTRAELMTLHAFKDGLIETERAFIGIDMKVLADLYSGLHYGIYLSGMDDCPVEDCPIVIGSRYFLLNKEVDQNRLTYDFELNVVPYERKDAEKDYKTLIDSLDEED